MTDVERTTQSIAGGHRTRGFALPTILISSIVMLMVLLVSVSSTVAVRMAIQNQYYTQLAQVAGEAGSAYAKACMAANGGTAQWTNANPLQPNTDCTGTQLAGFSCPSADARCSVTVNGNIRSRFSVPLPTGPQRIASTGTVDLLRTSNGAVWRTYTQNTAQNIINLLTYTLTISAGANGTVNTGVNGDYASGATPTITATPNTSYVFSSWSGSTGCSGTTTASYAITMDGNKTCTANFVVVDPWANWYSGIAATALAGKHVYKTDLGSTYAYKTALTDVTSPQGATGLDPNYPSNMSLVSPQTNPGVDFSAYPAQNACKAIGGRLPNVQELLAIYAGRATYGNNFQAALYWSSTEWGSDGTYFVNFVDGSTSYDGKANNWYVRCVSG